MKVCLGLVVALAACTQDEDLDIRVERQSATLATATESGWTTGSTVLVATPGTFTFPQPLSLRISMIDSKVDVEEGATPTLLTISRTTMAQYEAGPFEIVSEPVCQPTYCEAELSITDFGRSMLELTVVGTDGTEPDCFYFGVYEDADPTTASIALRDEAEEQQGECKVRLLD